MEEIIEVQISNELKRISKGDFFLIKELVSFKQLQQSKIDLKLNEDSYRVVNVLLYYIIMIQKNVKLQEEKNKNNNSFTFTQSGEYYRQICLKQISDYYIKNKMKIQIYEFSLVCSKILAVKVQECAHIIYYLVYGRFASHQYIDSICNKRQFQSKKRNFSKNQKESLQWYKKTRKSTVIQSENQHQLKLFSEQLHRTLKSKPKITNWGVKEKQNTKKNIKELTRESQQQSSLGKKNNIDQNEHQIIKLAEERKKLNRGNSTNNFIPHRIGQKQNSSILQNLSFCQKQFNTCTNWNRKGLMRKLKFNQFFDANQIKFNSRYQKNLSYDKSKDSADFIDKYTRSTIQKMGKISYENFKNISKELKLKNGNLDKIRNQCSNSIQNDSLKNGFAFQKLLQNQKKQQLCKKKQQGSLAQDMQTKKQDNNLFTVFGTNSSNQAPENLQNKIFKNNLILKKSPNTLFQDSTNLKETHLQKFISYQNSLTMSKKQTFLLQKQEDSFKEQEHITNLLRNDFNYKSGKDEDQTRNLNYFSQNSPNSMKNQFNGRLNLQKYKSDYRKFLKTQLLDRIKQAN